MKHHLWSMVLATVFLSSCGSTSKLYSWYNYEPVSYAVAKNPTPERIETLKKVYERLINEPKGSRKMPPPGICAEYGYLLYKQGQQERGLRLLEREIELYPESTFFIGNLIKQLKK
ncbi:DUF4810 domain-containing protein [uncultured Porphyromonas sp.]|uniref:DUF4810 domain-containing protein n=1 Tax=uncultured Porphyromonas sp. TaxID=159274 RepID=UPI00262ED1E3|nr:DUF4810 domain-containing protein [uncultured Porphyromonas sp.]